MKIPYRLFFIKEEFRMKQEEKSLKLQKAEEQVRIANARLARVQREEKQKKQKSKTVRTDMENGKKNYDKKNRCF